ncbi:hypothetical protein JCM15060_09870 [Halanaerobaculum tunisiense]
MGPIGDKRLFMGYTKYEKIIFLNYLRIESGESNESINREEWFTKAVGYQNITIYIYQSKM